MMKNKTVKYLLLSQFSLYGFLGICAIINPEFVLADGGVSNYGVHKITVLPFTLAFCLSGLFLIWSARSIPRAPMNLLGIRQALILQALLLFAVLLSTYPYMLNQSFKIIHITMGVLLLIFNLFFVGWISLCVCRDKVNFLLFNFEIIGFLMIFTTLSGLVSLLFIAQVITSSTFALFIIRLGSRITKAQT